MHTVELMEQAQATATQLGYRVRQEYLGGVGGGRCEVSGRKWIFLDVALTSSEQLAQILDALAEDPAIYTIALPTELASALGIRRAA